MLSVQRDLRRGRGPHREQQMSSATLVVKEEVRVLVTRRKGSSRSGPFVQPGFLQFSQQAAVSERMRSTESRQLFERYDTKS